MSIDGIRKINPKDSSGDSRTVPESSKDSVLPEDVFLSKKTPTFLRGIEHNKKDFINTQSSQQQATEYSGKVGDKGLAGSEENGEIIFAIDHGIQSRQELAEEAGSGYFKGRVLLWGGIAAGFLFIFGGAFLVSKYFTKVTVTIRPKVESVGVEDVLAAVDASVSKVLAAEHVIPAEYLEFPKKELGEFESTGREFIEDRAKGKVKIYNRFSSSPQKLVENTRFVTDGKLVFRLSRGITVPGAGVADGKIAPNFIEAELIADKAGEEFNISSEVNLRISGFQGTSKYDGFYALSSSGFSGGFRGEARVVSGEDLKNAEEQLTKQIYNRLKQEMARKIPPGFKYLDALDEIQIVKVSAPRERMRIDKFTVEVEAVGRSLIFREKDVLDFLKAVVLGGGQGRDFVPDLSLLNYKARNVNFDKDRSKSEVVISGSMKAKYNISQEEIFALIKNQKRGSVSEILKGRGEIERFDFYFFPPWLLKIPAERGKTKFVIQGVTE